MAATVEPAVQTVDFGRPATFTCHYQVWISRTGNLSGNFKGQYLEAFNILDAGITSQEYYLDEEWKTTPPNGSSNSD